MKTPLCKICQITGVLCPSCERKIEKGEVSPLDVKVSIFLGRRTKDIRELDEVSLLKVVSVDNSLVLLFRRGDSQKFLRYAKDVIREMEKEFRMRVIAIDYHPNLKEFIENVFHPIPIATINIIWLPDGTKETRVILERRVRSGKVEFAKKVIQKVMNVDVKVEAL